MCRVASEVREDGWGLDALPVNLRPIGLLRSEYQDPARTPIQPVFAERSLGRIEVFESYIDGLDDIEGFTHIHLLYWMHRAGPPALRVVPFLDDESHGVFATRAPNRPNAIGLSILKLVERRGSVLMVEDVDVLDGTPVLDIKPYYSSVDAREDARSGWLDTVDEKTRGRRGVHGGCACPEAGAERS